ncbi:DUF4387 domain-containing protein [Faecalispora jeddahensis]|uniref:DUF4387 domain-containing protein n=1 Tax=Faecalispora jeddahensis TaxID=1414721 RepID=UPI0004B1EDB0|nr:DUF4387 domain-containing protein [Faecalispora jeddahensis]MBE6745094.1 DUF4387 domain-containing protein [Oscillospiraceae bacterium]
MTYLKDIAKIIRSKNAGPFEVTMDIIFQNEEDYRRVLDSGVINRELVSKLYHIDPGKIITLSSFDAARAIKITLPRPRKQGSIGETDMHAAQQHVPLMLIELP